MYVPYYSILSAQDSSLLTAGEIQTFGANTMEGRWVRLKCALWSWLQHCTTNFKPRPRERPNVLRVEYDDHDLHRDYTSLTVIERPVEHYRVVDVVKRKKAVVRPVYITDSQVASIDYHKARVIIVTNVRTLVAPLCMHFLWMLAEQYADVDPDLYETSCAGWPTLTHVARLMKPYGITGGNWTSEKAVVALEWAFGSRSSWCYAQLLSCGTCTQKAFVNPMIRIPDPTSRFMVRSVPNVRYKPTTVSSNITKNNNTIATPISNTHDPIYVQEDDNEDLDQQLLDEAIRQSLQYQYGNSDETHGPAFTEHKQHAAYKGTGYNFIGQQQEPTNRWFAAHTNLQAHVQNNTNVQPLPRFDSRLFCEFDESEL